jgi:formate hydrogenlyase subunit 6/NADH:ubiquinone oxidoreductase subunit I
MLKPEERNTPLFLKAKKRGWLTKLPVLKQLYRKKEYPRGFDTQAAQIIPVNLTIGEMESQVVPLKLMDHFIEKAGTIVLMDCPCRVSNKCQKHDVHLGCIWMGKGASKIMDASKSPGSRLFDLQKNYGARYATKEEARERVHLALENGLVPALGKLLGDARTYRVLEHEDELMNFCFCCSCCCITALMKYYSSDYKNVTKRMKGVTITTDPEKCLGCGTCFKVCIYNGLKMVNGKSVHIPENCLACGRCEAVCPNEAISLTFDGKENLDEVVNGIIRRFEKIVDISG